MHMHTPHNDIQRAVCAYTTHMHMHSALEVQHSAEDTRDASAAADLALAELMHLKPPAASLKFTVYVQFRDYGAFVAAMNGLNGRVMCHVSALVL